MPYLTRYDPSFNLPPRWVQKMHIILADDRLLGVMGVYALVISTGMKRKQIRMPRYL